MFAETCHPFPLLFSFCTCLTPFRKHPTAILSLVPSFRFTLLHSYGYNPTALVRHSTLIGDMADDFALTRVSCASGFITNLVTHSSDALFQVQQQGVMTVHYSDPPRVTSGIVIPWSSVGSHVPPNPTTQSTTSLFSGPSLSRLSDKLAHEGLGMYAYTHSSPFVHELATPEEAISHSSSLTPRMLALFSGCHISPRLRLISSPGSYLFSPTLTAYSAASLRIIPPLLSSLCDSVRNPVASRFLIASSSTLSRYLLIPFLYQYSSPITRRPFAQGHVLLDPAPESFNFDNRLRVAIGNINSSLASATARLARDVMTTVQGGLDVWTKRRKDFAFIPANKDHNDDNAIGAMEGEKKCVISGGDATQRESITQHVYNNTLSSQSSSSSYCTSPHSSSSPIADHPTVPTPFTPTSVLRGPTVGFDDTLTMSLRSLTPITPLAFPGQRFFDVPGSQLGVLLTSFTRIAQSLYLRTLGAGTDPLLSLRGVALTPRYYTLSEYQQRVAHEVIAYATSANELSLPTSLPSSSALPVALLRVSNALCAPPSPQSFPTQFLPLHDPLSHSPNLLHSDNSRDYTIELLPKDSPSGVMVSQSPVFQTPVSDALPLHNLFLSQFSTILTYAPLILPLLSVLLRDTMTTFHYFLGSRTGDPRNPAIKTSLLPSYYQDPCQALSQFRTHGSLLPSLPSPLSLLQYHDLLTEDFLHYRESLTLQTHAPSSPNHIDMSTPSSSAAATCQSYASFRSACHPLHSSIFNDARRSLLGLSDAFAPHLPLSLLDPVSSIVTTQSLDVTVNQAKQQLKQFEESLPPTSSPPTSSSSISSSTSSSPSPSFTCDPFSSPSCSSLALPHLLSHALTQSSEMARHGYLEPLAVNVISGVAACLPSLRFMKQFAQNLNISHPSDTTKTDPTNVPRPSINNSPSVLTATIPSSSSPYAASSLPFPLPNPCILGSLFSRAHSRADPLLLPFRRFSLAFIEDILRSMTVKAAIATGYYRRNGRAADVMLYFSSGMLNQSFLHLVFSSLSVLSSTSRSPFFTQCRFLFVPFIRSSNS